MRAVPIFYIAFLIGVAAIGIMVGASVFSPDASRGNAANLELASLTTTVTVLVAMAVSALFWVGALVHLLCNRSLEGTERIVWLLVVILLNALGAVLYFFIAPLPPSARALSAA